MADITSLIRSITPLPNSMNLKVSDPIEIVFFPAMNSTSLNTNTIILKDSDGVQANLHYAYRAGNRTLTLTPLTPLKSLTTYTLEVIGKQNGVKDIMGNVSFRSYDYDFITEELIQEPETPDLPESPEEDEEIEVAPPVVEEPEITPPAPGLQLRVLNSFPEQNGLLPKNSKLALAFSLPIKESTTVSNIVLEEESISPLLEGLGLPIICSYGLSEDKQVVRIEPLSELIPGTRYTIKVKTGLESTSGIKMTGPYMTSFLSAHTYSLATVSSVKLTAGAFASSYSDLDIAELIGSISASLFHLMERKEGYEQSQWGFSFGPFGAEQYVRFSVVYQMALGQTLETSSGQRQEERLGDLTVGGGTTVASSIADLLKLLKEEVDLWWRVLNGQDDLLDEDTLRFVLSPNTATKAIENYPYPEFQTRVPFRNIGE